MCLQNTLIDSCHDCTTETVLRAMLLFKGDQVLQWVVVLVQPPGAGGGVGGGAGVAMHVVVPMSPAAQINGCFINHCMLLVQAKQQLPWRVLFECALLGCVATPACQLTRRRWWISCTHQSSCRS